MYKQIYGWFFIVSFSALCFLTSCIQDMSGIFFIEALADNEQIIERSWTVMIYMAADNDLESAAIHDINELEASKFGEKGISVLALLDRSEGHDATNGDWTDTRLYEIAEDSGGFNGVIVSKELSSSGLALEAGTPTELNMSDPNTLKNFLKFGRTNYPAKRYALIIWGHGTGWHSVAIDDRTGTVMLLSQLQEAIAGSVTLGTTSAQQIASKPLDFIGFDTCFGATLETVWELKDEATWFAGTPGSAPVSGWDYTEVFDFFCATKMDTEDLADAVANQKGVSKIDLQKVVQVKLSHDELAMLTAQTIETASIRTIVKDLLLTGVDSYEANSVPYYKFLDLYDLATVISENADQISSDSSIRTELQESAKKLQLNLREAAYLNGTSQQTGEGAPKLAVFLIPITSGSVPFTSHSKEYVQGSEALGQSSFVHDSAGWVPTRDGRTSLLDKIFYTSF